MKIKERIKELAIEFLKANPNGVQHRELCRNIRKLDKGLNSNTVHTQVWYLPKNHPEIFSNTKGTFKLKKVEDNIVVPNKSDDNVSKQISTERIIEKDFYNSFAKWIVTTLKECTKAVPLGGNSLGGKWATPDVIGIRKPKKSEIIELQTEIISAEIKVEKNANALITAFGQACSYKLFSHKSYMVIPNNSDDIDRVDALARILGIGLILFDSENPISPNFQIRVRAVKHEPDMFYVNLYCSEIEKYFE